MSEPDVPPNCPHCGQRLSYRKTGNAWRRRFRKDAIIETADEVHLYHCGTHGFYMVWPDGTLRYVLNSINHTDPGDFD